jgi:hypothetical protein
MSCSLVSIIRSVDTISVSTLTGNVHEHARAVQAALGGGVLFADRTSANTMRANQLRLWLSSMAYVLLCALRRIGLQHTRFAKASCGSIRLALLKIGALVTTSARRIKFAMASGCPYQNDFRQAYVLLTAAAR